MIVWLASYPRSGNTLLRILLNSVFGIKTYSIHNDENDIGSDRKTSDVVGHLFFDSEVDFDEIRKKTEYYFIKTHFVPDGRIFSEDKVIYLIRDGRESSVSYWNYMNNFSEKRLSLKNIIAGHIAFGNWGNHVHAWDPTRRPNTIHIRYEDIVKDKEYYIKVLSEFLHMTPVSADYPSFDELKAINSKFFRSGKTDSWKKEFKSSDHWFFWLLNRDAMVNFGYDNDMPGIFKSSLFKHSNIHKGIKAYQSIKKGFGIQTK